MSLVTKKHFFHVCCLIAVFALCLPACAQDKENSKTETQQQQSSQPATPEQPQKADSSLARLLTANGTTSLSDIQSDAIGALREVANLANDPALKDLETELQGALSQVIGAGGSILSSVAGGMQEGANKAQDKLDANIDSSGDGSKATVVNSKESLHKYLTVSIHKVEDLGNGTWRLTVALRNSNDFAVRLVGLDKRHTSLLLDADGFAYFPTKEQTKSITVVPRAAAKAQFTFTGLEVKPKTFRLFEADFPVETVI